MISSPRLVDTQIGFSGNSQIEHYDFGHDDPLSPIRGALTSVDFESGTFNFVQNRSQSHDYLQTPAQHIAAYKYFPITLDSISGSINVKYEYDKSNNRLFRIEVTFAIDHLEWKPFATLLETLVSQITTMFNQLDLGEHGVKQVELNVALQILGSNPKTFAQSVELHIPLRERRVLHSRNNAQASLNLYSLTRTAIQYYSSES